MAVTKIRKISSWVLILCTIITLAVLALFFFGGDNEKYKGEMWNPKHVDLLLYWQYILFGVTAFAAILLGIWQFASSFKNNPKGGVMGLVVIVLFAAMMFLSYTFGDTTPVHVLNSEAQVFNVPFWLKITDMWLYSTYILTALVILAIIGGSIKKIFSK
ncbi:magnesium-transporting ATPase (P-type) [Parabacteroides sp. PF5-5]|uniref:hypothetical protein n=1 Tax=unclassified Parabacteroides TaxID=2649774 RepID=UPI0024735953|nr:MULTISPECIES: hypothetical protein [unclassified Parabacteroides]MDH6303475.1 magnesium-transporting ATPase (P-type) [Parabacteroides sp. PH5-39]MDH6314797.1 magnesium-transporting ATPase (P-type) [Parabacteroides sp. PF5-13]MDH6318134.1 magnesium-transporting ATPase (P-type) [Parabacteroides sp. PH5-13]MDH6321934.1 magnesium-transporting ATPase (P-type) [Parabacteroides sp. PH5-8]MDH6326058.1 magnesium-transporting ATPase (P-type) [Parabacteroides sp. PH5-41]